MPNNKVAYGKGKLADLNTVKAKCPADADILYYVEDAVDPVAVCPESVGISAKRDKSILINDEVYAGNYDTTIVGIINKLAEMIKTLAPLARLNTILGNEVYNNEYTLLTDVSPEFTELKSQVDSIVRNINTLLPDILNETIDSEGLKTINQRLTDIEQRLTIVETGIIGDPSIGE